MKRGLRRRSLRLWLGLCRIWRWLANALDLLVLVRVPVLAVAIGVVAVVHVPQIRELFEISLSGDAGALEAFWAFGFAAGLSVVAWYSARTLFRFEYPRRHYDHRVKRRLGVWLPRFLSCAVPVAMALIYLSTEPPGGGLLHVGWALAYLVLAAGLLALSIRRRRILHRLGWSIDSAPRPGELTSWRDLGRLRYWHYAGLFAGIAGGFVGALYPAVLAWFGPLALLLGGMAWLVMMSTVPVYFCARGRIPLLTMLVFLAWVWTSLDVNDNHAVRLAADQRSTQDPPPGLHYTPADRPSLEAFIDRWWDEGRRENCNDRAWFVSSEGGGIRAAMWTVLVLAELDEASSGRLWRCTLAVSGVSGGSLGLATFAVHWRDTDGRIDADGLVAFMQGDFLAPVLGSMFGADLLQRFLPGRWLSDRGEALEDAWVTAYEDRLGSESPGKGLAMPLAQTAFDREGRALPAVLLNTTVVADGRRLIQHPFASLGNPPLPGSVDGAQWLPAELPVFSAVHNSARFTLISPAGTVRKRENDRVDNVGQLVDGGYFENSAITTLQHFLERFRAATDGDAAIRAIHVSNDPGVAPLAPNGRDRCPLATSRKAPTIRGEARAPLDALLATRNARGQYARQALGEAIASRPDDRLWHYRLCRRERDIPLGWTIGEATTEEMREQLAGAEGAADNAGNSRGISRQF